MSLEALAAVGAPTWTPVLAATDWTDLVQGGGTAAVIALLIYGIKLLRDGTLRLEREVTAERERADAAEAREKLAVSRAEKAEQGKERIQEAVLKEQGLASMELSLQGKELVRSATRIQELIEKLIDAFLRLIEKR